MSQFDLFDDINEIVAGYCKDSESVSSELVVPASTALFAIVTRETQNIKDKSVKSKVRLLSVYRPMCLSTGSEFLFNLTLDYDESSEASYRAVGFSL